MKDAPILHRFEYLAFWPARALLLALPHTWSRRLGAAFGRLFYALGTRRRKIARDNLQKAVPNLDERTRERIARESFRNLGAMLFDTLSAQRFNQEQLCRRIEFEGFHHLDEAEKENCGVLVLSAHHGHWEMAAWALNLAGRSVDVVGRPTDNPHLQRELVRIRTRFGNRMIEKHGAARPMLAGLRDGGYVGVLIDQRVKPREGLTLEFFNRPALTTPIAARLSKKTGAPVVPIYGAMEPGGRYRVRIDPPIWPQDQDAEELTRRYLALTEEAIRAHPERWLWMHRRWRLD